MIVKRFFIDIYFLYNASLISNIKIHKHGFVHFTIVTYGFNNITQKACNLKHDFFFY